MQEYERPVTILNHGLPTKATLKVIRLPTSWYAVVWENKDRYATLSQDRTDLNGGHSHMTDEEFLSRVQLVASFVRGIDFTLDPAIDQRRKVFTSRQLLKYFNEKIAKIDEESAEAYNEFKASCEPMDQYTREEFVAYDVKSSTLRYVRGDLLEHGLLQASDW
jgi:hypothetical protein